VWHAYFAVWTTLLSFKHGFDCVFVMDLKSWTGTMTAAVAGAMLMSLYSPMRRQTFELFYRLHWAATILVLVGALIHGAYIVFVGAGLWIVDVLVRCSSALGKHHREAQLLRISSDVVRVIIPTNGFKYRAGQYIFICVPNLGIMEWHPFSMSNAPWEAERNGYFHLHVRALGDWTKKLWNLASGSPKVLIYFEGPYGEPVIDIEGSTYEMFLMLSAGIGITTLQSRYNSLVEQVARGRPIELCWFVWSVRSTDQGRSAWGSNSRRSITRVTDDFCCWWRRSAKVAPKRPSVFHTNMFDGAVLTASFQPLMLSVLSLSQLVLSTRRQEKISENMCTNDKEELPPAAITTNDESFSNTLKLPPIVLPPHATVEILEEIVHVKKSPRVTSNNLFLAAPPLGLEPYVNFDELEGVPQGIRSPPSSIHSMKQSQVEHVFPSTAMAKEAHRDVPYLHTEFYLTGPHASEEAETGTPFDKRLITVGRPNFDEIFSTMATIALQKGKKRIAVAVRGPNAFAEDAQRACRRHSSADVKFDLCIGAFEL
jgi:hypothetical protein